MSSKTADSKTCPDCDHCQICQRKGGNLTKDRIDHIMACMVEKGLASVKVIGKDGPKWSLTATGVNKAEAMIRSWKE